MTQLKADCANCFGLCCVALQFTASSDFAFDKAAGEPCRNLLADFGCSIHPELRQRGMKGCTVYECFGAGQRVAQQTYAGESWRDAPESASEMFAVFPVVRQLHELLWYLTDASERVHGELVTQLREAYAETDLLAAGTPDEIRRVDVTAHRDRVNTLLKRASDAVRSEFPAGPDHRGADLMGADFAHADLRGASFRGAYLIAANLSGASLQSADLIGADLRDADVRGADLRGALFLTQPQVNSARGDGSTTLPASLDRPSHWV